MDANPIDILKNKLASAGLEGDGTGPRRTRASRDPIDSTKDTFMGASLTDLVPTAEGTASGEEAVSRRRRVRVPREPAATALASPQTGLSDELVTAARSPLLEKNNSLEEALEVLSKEKAAMEAAHAATLRSLQDELEKVRKSNAAIQETLSIYQDLTTDLTSDANPTPYVLADHIKGLLAASDERDQLQATKAELESQVSDLLKQIEKSRMERSSADSSTDEIVAKLEQAREEIASLHSRNDQLEADLDRLQREKEEVSPSLEALEAQIDQLEKSRHEANTRAAELETQLVESRQQVADLETRLAAAQEQAAKSVSEALAGVSLDAADEEIIAQAEADLKRMEELIRETENYIAELEKQQEPAPPPALQSE